MSKAIELLFAKALKAERQGGGAQARSIYQRIVAQQPEHARARARLARLGAGKPIAGDLPASEIGALLKLVRENDPEGVIARAEKLLVRYPGSFALQCFIGEAYVSLERFEPALEAYRRAVLVNSDCGRTKGRLGHVLFKCGQIREAVEAYDQAISLEPKNLKILWSIGSNLLELERHAQAEKVFRKALSIDPQNGDAVTGLGIAVMSQARLDEAKMILRSAVALRPADATSRNALGSVHLLTGAFEEAEQELLAALNLRSDFVDARFALGTSKLVRGNFEQGLRLYENRKLRSESAGVIDISVPEWLGVEDIASKSLYVHWEQGLGDTIQFCRYVTMLRDRGANVTLCVQTALKPLLAGSFPDLEIVTALPDGRDFDYHTPLLSLPLAMGTRLQTIPAPVPYLDVNPARVRKWTERLGSTAFKVGVRWVGGQRSVNDKRSLSLADLAPLAAIPGVRLISLVQGADFAGIPDGLVIEQPEPDFDRPGEEFLDTAAIMRNCDLVISCDTSVAHLAGALGIPTWLILPQVAEWRWLIDREDTPWYPTMRLFRQTKPGDWEQIMLRVRLTLIEKIKVRRQF